MSEMALSSSLKSVDDSVGGKPFLFFLVSSNGLIVAAVSYDEENKYNIDSMSTPTVTNLGKSTVTSPIYRSRSIIGFDLVKNRPGVEV
jgi:hypothetical protein